MNTRGQIVVDGLESYIKEGKQQLTVRFNNEDITFPYEMNIRWNSPVPDTYGQCKLQLKTKLVNKPYAVGDNVRMTIEVYDRSAQGVVAMPMAIVEISSEIGVRILALQNKRSKKNQDSHRRTLVKHTIEKCEKIHVLHSISTSVFDA